MRCVCLDSAGFLFLICSALLGAWAGNNGKSTAEVKQETDARCEAVVIPLQLYNTYAPHSSSKLWAHSSLGAWNKVTKSTT